LPGFSTASVSSRKRRGEGHTRREEILQAAKELFLQVGYDATTIRKIADRVGVSAPALYLYFADKEAILIALCDQTFGFLIDRIGAIGKEKLAPRDQLRRCGEAYVRFGLEHPEEYWLTFMAGITPKKIKEQGGHRATNLEAGQPGTTGAIAFQHVVSLLRDAEAAGVKLNYSHETAAELLWMGLHGLVAALINNPDFPWSNREELIQGMLDVVTKGVLAD
jgi:AcrR family transcriptional regulator